MIEELRAIIREMKRQEYTHSESCSHVYCSVAPCDGGEDCYEHGGSKPSPPPCDPKECFAAEAETWILRLEAIAAKMESVNSQGDLKS